MSKESSTSKQASAHAHAGTTFKHGIMFKAKPASTVVKVRPLRKLKDMVA